MASEEKQPVLSAGSAPVGARGGQPSEGMESVLEVTNMSSLSITTSHQSLHSVPSARARLRRAVKKLHAVRVFSMGSASFYESVNPHEDPESPGALRPPQGAVLISMILPWASGGKSINWLFFLMPLAILSHERDWPDAVTFILNFLAMVPLASLLGDFTEELAGHLSSTTAGLLNATFGNAVEVVVAVQALAANELRVVQASMMGSVLSNLLLVLGSSFIAAGINFKESEFNAVNAINSAALLLLSTLGIVLPSTFPDTQDGSTSATGGYSVLGVSRFSAVFLLLLYLQVLVFQLRTHADISGDEDEKEVPRVSPRVATTGLAICTILVSYFSDLLVDSIDGFTKASGLSKAFVGLILLPIVGNAVEHIVAIQVAYKGKMELAMGVALGSGVQVALFVVPVVVVAGWVMDKDMTLAYPMFEIAIYLMSVLIVAHLTVNGRSNWIFGSTLVTTYVLIAVAVLFENDA